MSNLHEMKEKLKALQEQSKKLKMEIHELEEQIASADVTFAEKKAAKMGFKDIHDFNKYRTYVQRGVIDWDGNFKKHGKVNVTPWLRPIITMPYDADWTKVVPNFRRNCFLELFRTRWHSTLSHDLQLNDTDADYKHFLDEGFGPLTDKDLAFIKDPNVKETDTDKLGFGPE